MEAHRDLGLGAVALSEAHPGPSTRQLVRDGDLDVSQEGESEGIPLHVVVSSSRSGLLNGGPQPGTNSTSGSSGSKAHLAAEEEAPRVDGYTWDSMAHMLTTYALILVYIISDAGRTITLQKALSTTVTNSTSMGLVCYVLGVIVASCLTLFTHGLAGLRLAMSPRKILYCLPAAFLFALATALGNLAFAMGISSGLYVVLGKFYTPVAALGARWIMGKFYMWLEWFALIILTLSSAAFGYLQAYPIQQQGRPMDSNLAAIALVLGSAATSALASLVTERILKGETEPFHMIKVRLDFGSVLSSLVLLPVIGMIATRPQDVPWVSRPVDYATCPVDSVCWILSEGTCDSPACECPCASKGIFAGWNSWMLLLAVAVNTTQGWLVGKVTQRFSVVHRAIADSFSLLAIYFLCDPLFNGKSLADAGLNLVALIVPLSTATFSVATSEMQKVFQARQLLEEHRKRPHAMSFDSDDSDVMSNYMPSPDLSPQRMRTLSGGID
ncbi:unnamed protein product [Polarella glacialis]|uniref:Uncharacterized protein n=1 Tax=Polarella glacialis TaxID=89957 RepID=A0A813GKL1_POLGL|nr:unnamed protein product [Polarella glacialis]